MQTSYSIFRKKCKKCKFFLYKIHKIVVNKVSKVIKKFIFASGTVTCKLYLLDVIVYKEVDKVKTQHSCFVKSSVLNMTKIYTRTLKILCLLQK